jgi:GR25 family glycosyltransferase involved in LPS biosynthesis
MIDFFCIHKEGDEESKDPLNDAINSGKQFGINVIPYAGVYSNIDDIIAKEGLIVNPYGSHKVTRRGKGVLGCFLSHYFLWKTCIEKNKPIGVLEYDAIIIRKFSINLLDQFDDYLNLDYTRHTHLGLSSKGQEYINQIDLEKYNPVEVKNLEENPKSKKHFFKYINNNHIKGAFGYVIKPAGAKKLVDATKEHGILPADVQPNLYYCDVKYVTPSIVMLNPKGISNRFGGSHTNTGHLST